MSHPDTLWRLSLCVPPAAGDLTVAELWDLSPEGFEEHADQDPEQLRFVLYTAPDTGDGLRGALRDLVVTLGQQFGDGVTLAEERIANENWREAWKVHFTLQRIDRFVIRPSWIEYEPAPQERVIHLDPGSAFGSGLHESTRLCLRWLVALDDAGAAPDRVLDFGTGTGILGVAAGLLWRSQITAVDDDPLAVEACRENAERNGQAHRFALAPALPEAEAGFELVLANIQRPVLLAFAEALHDHLIPGGHLILSGLLEGDEADIRAAYTDLGLTVQGVTREKDWIAMHLTRGGA